MNPTLVAIMAHGLDRVSCAFLNQTVPVSWDDLSTTEQQEIVDFVSSAIAEYPTDSAQTIALRYAAGGPGPVRRRN